MYLKINNPWRPIIFVICVWLFPILVSILAPFEVPLQINWVLISFVIFFFSIVLSFPLLLFSGYISSFKKYVSRPFSKSGLVLFFAFLSVVVQCLDFFIIRGVGFSFDIHGNRDIVTQQSGVISMILMLLLPFCYISFIGFFQERRRFFYLVPFLLSSALYLLSGNRQFFVFGLLLLIVMFLMFVKNISIKKIAIVIFAGLLLTSFMFFYQFKRQPFAEGMQAEFLYNIAKLECVGDYCDSGFITPMAYLYLYFGIEYSGLSASYDLISEDDDIRAPIFSQTIPVIYRRIEGPLDLPKQYDIDMLMHEKFENRYNIFPRFWRTMFSSFLMEYGPLGIIVLLYLILFFGCIYWYNFLRERSVFSQFVLCCFYASLAFGVMFFPLFEPHLFFMFLYLNFSVSRNFFVGIIK